jgi:uncharacterized phage-like protein YoqJ
MRIIGATGQRPKTLGGYHPQVMARMNKLAYWYLTREKPDKIVSGMALGWDTAVANIAFKENIPFVAAVPFPQQADIWPQAERDLWEFLLSKAERVIRVSESYSPEALKKRNKVIVDESTEIVSLWNGNRRSGTGHCIRIAELECKPVTNLYNEYLRLSEHLI